MITTFELFVTTISILLYVFILDIHFYQPEKYILQSDVTTCFLIWLTTVDTVSSPEYSSPLFILTLYLIILIVFYMSNILAMFPRSWIRGKLIWIVAIATALIIILSSRHWSQFDKKVMQFGRESRYAVLGILGVTSFITVLSVVYNLLMRLTISFHQGLCVVRLMSFNLSMAAHVLVPNSDLGIVLIYILLTISLIGILIVNDSSSSFDTTTRPCISWFDDSDEAIYVENEFRQSKKQHKTPGSSGYYWSGS